MSKNMLGKLLLSEIQGPRDDFETKLAGDDGELWLTAFKRFLRKENPWVEVNNKNLIFVDRTIRPKYPYWVKEVLYPELESTGPAEFDVGKLEFWLHEEQERDQMKQKFKEGKDTVYGDKIHSYLKDHGMIKDCLDLRALEEIQKKGITFFRKHFKGKSVFGWKSVVLNCDGGLYSPYLGEEGGEVRLGWRWLTDEWYFFFPVLLFAS